MSPEAIRRILKSKWRPSETEVLKRRERWERRKGRIEEAMGELGLRGDTVRGKRRTQERGVERNGGGGRRGEVEIDEMIGEETKVWSRES
jgi:hypothetical protein